MTSRRTVLGAVGTALAATGTVGCLGGGSGPTTTGGTSGDGSLSVRSDAFAEGEPIPTRHTCDGEDVSPPLRVAGVPDGAATLAVVVDDPDAGGFTHWLLWNVPTEGTIPGGVPRTGTVADLGDARQGTNDFDAVGYRGPCPPAGDGPHTYRFTVHAVDRTLDLAAGSERSALASALDGTSIARGRLTGEYERAGAVRVA